MYQPPSFREPRTEVMHDLIEAFPLATLVTAGADGPFATHLPVVLDRAAGPLGTLRGHVARANPHHRLATAAPALVLFRGPDAYVSPSLYPSKADHGRVVPTWNYIAVHAYGPLAFVDDPAFVLGVVEALTRRFEGGRAQPWAVDDAPREYVDALARAVVGVELPIARLEGKWKMSQNRDARDAAGVAEGLAGSTDAVEREVARIVAERLAARGAATGEGPERS